MGKRLPELYKKYSGKAFRIERNTLAEIKRNKGRAFVIAAHKALKLKSIKASTVAYHYGTYARRIQVD